MDKLSLYKQIQDFNTKIVNEKETKTKRFYYVQDDIAIDKTNFIKELVQNDPLFPNQFDEVLDLCYGSGNLTTHILFDSGINYQNITYNDLNTNDRNNELGIGTKSDHDFLDENGFTTKYDLIIFNPQIGGSELGAVTFESNIKPINFDDSLENYLITLGIDIDKLTISQNLTERSYLIHSDTLTKKEMEEMGIKDIKLFNYYDVFYQSKKNNKEGTNSNIVKLKKTIDKISKSNTILAFFGEPKYAELLFADYTYIRQYSESSGKQFYILGKHSSSKKCFTNNHGQFHEINCETNDKSIDYDRIDNFDDLVLELDKYELHDKRKRVNNEETFRTWWYDQVHINSDGKEFEKPTKNAYYNGIKRLGREIEFNFFEVQNITEIEKYLERLSKGDLKDFNTKDGYNPSNGLKQYIKFLQYYNGSNLTSKELTIQKTLLFSDDKIGNLNFEYKNILFKGVPGTGKSRAIDTIIEKHLAIKDEKRNILRVNIHSASSNSDLMQGIGISTNNDGLIKYSEKQGLILDIIKRSTFNPNQPFVLILEEIQENSLNELIGDLIYLIEDGKRAQLTANNQSYESYEQLIEELIQNDNELHYVEIPYLVNDSTDYKKMIMPDNLFIFCTSNYRDDKKVIEDNLLRRFEVIEIYPVDTVVNEYAKEFFENLNKSILKTMHNNHEIHPDRFLIGHAIWKNVENKNKFYKAFSKLITEFKDIREIEFDTFKAIIKELPLPSDVNIDFKDSYYDLIKDIQTEIGYEFID